MDDRQLNLLGGAIGSVLGTFAHDLREIANTRPVDVERLDRLEDSIRILRERFDASITVELKRRLERSEALVDDLRNAQKELLHRWSFQAEGLIRRNDALSNEIAIANRERAIRRWLRWPWLLNLLPKRKRPQTAEV